MSTCKDCLHYEVCTYHIDEETTMTVNECSHGFKHKDQYVKLPAYVGQPVWRLNTNHKYLYETREWQVTGYNLDECKVSMIQQKADKSWKVRITRHGNVEDYNINDVNKYLYFTEEAAKARLEELEKELKKNEL